MRHEDHRGPSAVGTTFPMIVLGALSLSIGWGIRGNFGHEYGAMIPGALAAMGVVLVSGRDDWYRRIGWFGFFGALGWSFGGSISYMQVIAYTHSGHLPSVIYGFACLFVIGFIWGAIGGAGTALPACIDRRRMVDLLVPILVVFAFWILQDVVMALKMIDEGDRRHEHWLYWYDTDWVAALLALVAALLTAAVRRRFCAGTRLVLYASIGWWIAFLLLVNVLGLRMTPPRGDNWAGALGMTVGIFIWLLRNGLAPAAVASLVSGFIGGLGFALATLIKLVGMKSGLETNWHSVLEQSYGLINGIGVAVAMAILASRTPALSDPAPVERRWADAFCAGFVAIGITYVNIVKNVEQWVKNRGVPATMYGLDSFWWFNIGYVLIAGAFVVLAVIHLRRPLAILPDRWLGRGQMLYLILLWWMVAGNLMRAIPPFHQQRLITEGIIQVNAVICTVIILALSGLSRTAPRTALSTWKPLLLRIAGIGLLGMIASTVIETGVTRWVYASAKAPHASLHIRFGPNATATKAKPKAGQMHP